MLQHKLWQLAVPWLLQANCLLCNRLVEHSLSQPLCRRCHTNLQQCQRTYNDQRSANLVSWGHYQDSLRRLLHQLKYENQTAIANLFGQLLAQAWQQQQLPQCAVIPIPLHASKQTQRGYNQAELIARQFCQFTGMRCYPQLLQRTKATQAQHGLSQSQRLTNLQSAFSTTDHRHLAAPILLIDDIYTTGATIQAATHCLHQGGYQVWGTLVVAR